MNAGVSFNPTALWLYWLSRVVQKSWWISLLVWLVAIAPARAAELELRVAIEQDIEQVNLGSSTAAVVKDGSGQVLAEIPSMRSIQVEAEAGSLQLDQWQTGVVWVEPSEGGYVYIDGKWYRGRALVVPTSGGLTAVNYVDLEEYLYSVVGGEMPSNWHLEALKAQAVAARSFVLYRRQTGANTVFDVGDTTTWQVYEGIEDETPNTRAAVDATRGQVLTHGGRIIEAVFHSSSGGHTENVEDVWSSPLPYLRAVQDFDQEAPVYRWTETMTADAMRQRITGVGNILSFAPERTTRHGRIISMRVTGDQGSRVLSGAELRQALNLRSTLFTVTSNPQQVASAGGAIAPPSSFTINGGGFGHGLGMSQWGAFGLARQGFNYQQILLHYYTGAALSRIEVQ